MLRKEDNLKVSDDWWLLQRYVELIHQYLLLLRRIAEFHRINDHPTFSMEFMHRLLEIYPDFEKYGREAMERYIEHGDEDGAMKVYRQLQHAARERRKVELEQDTVQLDRQNVSLNNENGV